MKASARRPQLITTYGVGSLLPVESESFMVAGIEHWNTKNCEPVEDSRLRQILGVDQLLTPPGGERPGMVPMVRFPEWVSCPTCHRLDKFWRIADKPADQYVNKCRHCVVTRLVPSRFVACCRSGHIQDFPYRFWVHRGIENWNEGDHALRLTTDPADSTLAGISIRCSCGASRTLEGALGSGSLYVGCSGLSPWLDTEHEACQEGLVGLQRGASNVWFADVRSALTVDRSLTAAETVLEKILPELRGVDPGDIDLLLAIKARQHSVGSGQLIDAFRRHSSAPEDLEAARKQLREDEYEALARTHPEKDGSETFVCLPEELDGGSGEGKLVELVSRVPRLREVRVLTGFARVSSIADGSSSGRLTRNRASWLPAVEVLGEGVFVRFRGSAVTRWEKSDFAQTRATMLNAARQRAGSSASDAPLVSPRMLLLHSLSHVLMRELALDTGYPASSIRERVYAEGSQAGILLYTASADAAGSLGGLCSQGGVENLTRIVLDAAESAQWCSADPVCLESTATGAGAVNLAACHSCMLAPEVSCEFQNRHLDRACLVGEVDEADQGFLSPLL